MKKLFAIALLCLITTPALARPRDAFRDIGGRMRERVVRVIHVIVTLGDNLLPPRP